MALAGLAGWRAGGLRNGLPNCKVRCQLVHADRPSRRPRAPLRRRRRTPSTSCRTSSPPTSTRCGRRSPAWRAALAARQDPVRFPGLARRRRRASCSTAAPTLADDFVRRLTLYKLRAKVTIAKQDQCACRRFVGMIQALHKLIQLAARSARFPKPPRVRPPLRRAAAPPTGDRGRLARAAHRHRRRRKRAGLCAGRCLPA